MSGNLLNLFYLADNTDLLMLWVAAHFQGFIALQKTADNQLN